MITLLSTYTIENSTIPTKLIKASLLQVQSLYKTGVKKQERAESVPQAISILFFFMRQTHFP